MPEAISEATTVAPDDLLAEAERMRAGMRALRQRAEEAAERLIALMDELDGDSDLEPSTTALAIGYGPSGELDECEDEGDAEPSLGWAGQSAAQFGTCDDREGDEHDGSEPDADGEYSLGWHGAGAGLSLTRVCSQDLEGPDEDRESSEDGDRFSTPETRAAARQGRREGRDMLATLPVGKRFRNPGGNVSNVGEVMLCGPGGNIYRASTW